LVSGDIGEDVDATFDVAAAGTLDIGALVGNAREIAAREDHAMAFLMIWASSISTCQDRISDRCDLG
jgi:hypothetical protein